MGIASTHVVDAQEYEPRKRRPLDAESCLFEVKDPQNYLKVLQVQPAMSAAVELVEPKTNLSFLVWCGHNPFKWNKRCIVSSFPTLIHGGMDGKG